MANVSVAFPVYSLLEHTLLFITKAESIGKVSLQKPVLITSVAIAALHYFTENNFRVFRNAQKIEVVFTYIRLCSLSWSIDYLDIQLLKNGFSRPFMDYSMKSVILSIGVILGNIIAFVIVMYLNNSRSGKEMVAIEKLGENDPQLKNSLEGVKVEWDRGFDEIINEWFLVKLIAVNISLIIFAHSKLPFLIQAIANTCTLLQISRRNWLHITKEFVHPSHNKKIQLTYEPIFFRDYSKSPEESCAVCLDVPTRRYYFCENHSYDQACLTALFIKEMDKFRIVNQMIRMSHTENGREVKATYNVYAREDEKPKCPECRQIPLQNRLYVRVWDEKRMEFCWGNVTWLNYQPEQKVQVKLIDSFEVEGVSYLTGTLQDGSHVHLRGNTSMLHKTYEVTILSVGVVNGLISLNCQF